MPIIINAPMKGMVRFVDVKEGDQLSTRDDLLILETMHMQTPVFPPQACTVLKIMVSEGDFVAEGQALAYLEATP